MQNPLYWMGEGEARGKGNVNSFRELLKILSFTQDNNVKF
jgi:hypothetical protein